jgi:hypothetical protein
VDTVLLEVRNKLGMVGNDGERVTGGNESIGAINHVSVTVTVGSSTEGDVVLVDNLDQRVGIGQVGVGVTTVEVGARLAVLGRTSESELLLEDGLAVRTSDAGKTIEKDLEVRVRREELLDQVKVEDVLEHVDIVGSAVNDLDLEGSVGVRADIGNINVGDRGNLVGGEGLGGLVDLVGDRLRGRTAVGQVVLDTEVVLGACETMC